MRQKRTPEELAERERVYQERLAALEAKAREAKEKERREYQERTARSEAERRNARPPRILGLMAAVIVARRRSKPELPREIAAPKPSE